MLRSLARVRIVAGLLANFSITVVAFQRDKLAAMASIFYRNITGFPLPCQVSGLRIRGERGLGEEAKNDAGLHLDQALATYGDVFGQENVVVVSYDGLRDMGIQPFQFIVREVLGVADKPE